MKKSIVLALAGVALTAAYFGPRLVAQTPAAPAGGTRIAVVNIFDVFTKYQKAKFFKDEMDTTLKPYRDKAKVIQETMKQWKEEAEKPMPKYPKENLETGLRQKKRELEDLDLEARRLIGKKQEDQLVLLWKEVNDTIKSVATTGGYQMVVGFGEPGEVDPASFPAISRRMQSFEVGASSPLYAADSINLTAQVIDTLNRSYGGSRPATPPIQPTSLQKQP